MQSFLLLCLVVNNLSCCYKLIMVLSRLGILLQYLGLTVIYSIRSVGYASDFGLWQLAEKWGKNAAGVRAD